jgi:hypothetical protein
MAFNENTRVKIPAILHLSRLGYRYQSLSNARRDEGTNIFLENFKQSMLRINPDADENDVKRLFEDVSLALDNEDLGKAFYESLTASSGIRLIDFKNFYNNSFHVVTELPYKNGDDEFRPDITLLVNGMPLAFVEVKKPNNEEGVLAERDRINRRFKNNKRPTSQQASVSFAPAVTKNHFRNCNSHFTPPIKLRGRQRDTARGAGPTLPELLTPRLLPGPAQTIGVSTQSYTACSQSGRKRILGRLRHGG